MNTQNLKALCKDIPYLLKEKVSKGIRSRTLAYTMTLISILSAFQNVPAQSDPETKNIVTMIADAMESPEFKSLSTEKQAEKIGLWILKLSDKIQQQFSEKIEKGEFNDAEKYLAFFERISKDIKDDTVKQLIQELRTALEKGLEKQQQEKNRKDQEYKEQAKEFSKIVDNITHNSMESGGLQYVGEKMYATFTSSSVADYAARDKAAMGLNAFIIRNNLKQTSITVNHKLEKSGNTFINTAFVEINN